MIVAPCGHCYPFQSATAGSCKPWMSSGNVHNRRICINQAETQTCYPNPNESDPMQEPCIAKGMGILHDIQPILLAYLSH